jgi:DNA invertase Pin-like site-specific DNA recombinase
MQSCSIDAQKRVIREYANRNGFEIVRTYSDNGRSGLTLRGRPGLSILLRDIAYGRSDYAAVLVYDISRWGRFQDPDEAAHYEFLCKALGVPVHYCAEEFGVDGRMPTFVVKSLKRTIAAEYSRELSTKCFRGQRRLAEMGFRMGGICGYGFRRLAVSEDGCRQRVLRPGELKSVSTDRVVLSKGPGAEVDIVRRIFAKAAERGASYAAIAMELNASGIMYKAGRAWTGFVIEGILRNKKYAGWHIWNRTTGKLGTTRRCNPVGEWVVVPNAFQPIVSLPAYEKAQRLHANGRRWSRERLLQSLEKRRSGLAELDGPSLTTLRRRLIGVSELRPSRGTSPLNRADGVRNTRQRIVELRNQVLDKLSTLFPKEISEFHLSGKSRPVLKLANDRIVSVVVCAKVLRKTGIMRWMFRPIPEESSFITLICLELPLGVRYFLVPRITIAKDCSIGTNHPILKTGLRIDNLSQFREAATVFTIPDSKGALCRHR